MASEYEKWMAIGKELDLSGSDLRQFVIQQQNDERIRRVEERERQRKEAEEERERLRKEAEEERRRKEAEEERQRKEAEEKQQKVAAEERERLQREAEIRQRELEAQRQFELEKLRLQTQVEMRRIDAEQRSEASRSSTSMMSNNEMHGNMRMMKLSMFDEEKDDLDVFLSRFERTCQMCKVPENDRTVHLAKLLKGSALEIYEMMPDGSLFDYELLKNSLLKRFQQNEKGYRKRFKRESMQNGETPQQFVSRLKRYLNKWREMAGLEATYEGMVTLMLRDQFFVTCSNDLQTFLKEKGNLSLEEMLKQAEYYIEAHQYEFERKKKNEKFHGRGEAKPNVQSKQKFQHEAKSDKSETEKQGRPGAKSCHLCGSDKHLMANCDSRGSANSAYQQKKIQVQCFKCKQFGHKANACNNAGSHSAAAMCIDHRVKHFTADGGNNRDERKIEKIDVDQESNRQVHKCGQDLNDGDVKLDCGCKLPVVASAISQSGAWQKSSRIINALPTRAGKVNGISIPNVLRDSGCTTVCVKADLVQPEQYTGQSEACVLIDGVVKCYPTAIIEIDSPFYKGKAKALCMEKPLHDLIIGNIDGAKLPMDIDFADAEVDGTILSKQALNQMQDKKISTEKVPTEHEKQKERRTDENENDIEAEFAEMRNINVEQVDDNGEVEQRTKPSESWTKIKRQVCEAVITRSMAKKADKPRPSLKAAKIDTGSINYEVLRDEQKNDETLQKYWNLAKTKDQDASKAHFEIKKDLLYRVHEDKYNRVKVMQIMVPVKFREKVMQVAHDGLLSGHFGNRKTLERILTHFYFPGIHEAVKRYVWSCDCCQRNMSKGHIKKVPLGKLPLIDTPFQFLSMDIIGPIIPASERGHKYILTVIDMCTRYPEAIALKDISTTTVADALLDIYSRIGVPKRIHHDNGSQFVSNIMQEVNKLLSIRATTSTAYHPMGNSVIENWNKSLKSSLKKLTMERVKDWDRYISPLLFAMRDTPHNSTTFSSFELIYGRPIRGPMAILKELWTNEEEEGETKTVYQYVIDLRDKIEETCKIAQEELSKVQHRNPKYYNRKTKMKDLKIGDLALLLLPLENNKLQLQWRGPYEVVGRIGQVDYQIKLPTGKVKTFHGNMLKKYYQRGNEISEVPTQKTDKQDDSKEENKAAAASTNIITEETDEEDEMTEANELGKMQLYNSIQKETYKDVHVNPELTEKQKEDVRQLLEQYKSVFSDVPSVTNLIEHEIELTSQEPVVCKHRPVPFKMQTEIDHEIENMLKMNIIERADDSKYNSPLVCVRKSDNSIRLCVDFSKLNLISKFDPEPMVLAEDIFTKLARSKFLNKFDMAKGYWAVKMADNSKDYTTFTCSKGKMRFRVLPFGLASSGSTYVRMMRRPLEGCENTYHYIDDVISHSKEWEGHMEVTRQFLSRVKKANLTLRPSKVYIGYDTLDFLGHTIKGDSIMPRVDSIQKILNIPRPTTKKQVRSLLATVSYYAKFIPHCSEILSPISDLVKKCGPEKVQWGEVQERSFNCLKRFLSDKPILKLPDMNKEFHLFTDANNNGIAGCLQQLHDDKMHPVAFVSRKMLPREMNYTVGEKEGLAVIYSVSKFNRYLYNNKFVLHTDHKGLSTLSKGSSVNSRIQRWQMYMNQYTFTVNYIPGDQNVFADYLSRLWSDA